MTEHIFPAVKECHCGNVAYQYYSREFINAVGHKVVRIFYRCTNCKSRISDDFIPEMDKAETINVFDFKNNIHLFKTFTK